MKFIDKIAKAESKSQQRLMGMVHAYQNGTLDNFSDLPKDLQKKIKRLAKNMTHKQTKEYAETKHKKNMPEKKAEKVFKKLAADAFEEMLDRRKDIMLYDIDRHNKKVTKDTAKTVGAGTAAGATAGLGYGGYKAYKGSKGAKNVLKTIAKNVGKGGVAAALAAGALALPGALKKRVTRDEERKMLDVLDARHDMAREQRIRRGAELLKKHYANRQNS